ncbi:MAG: peptidoglycan DD-metalloendopeptidase family protein [Candidatus Kerfeldbacteria bacterium]|nr:peptidoglycan DD-metalloendopeptidase family protein [Candidatus Kerfeldbacteria bacterium]
MITYPHLRRLALFFAAGVLCATPVFAAINATEFEQLIEAEKNKDDGLQDLQVEIQEKSQSAKELSEQLDIYKQNLADAKAQQDTLNNQIAQLNTSIQAASTSIEKKNLELQVLQLEVEALQKQIQQSEADILNSSDRLGNLLRKMYINKQKTALEVTFSNTTFSNFFSDLTYSAEVQSDVKKSLTQIKHVKEVLEQRRGEVKDKQAEESVQKESLQAQKESMEGEQQFKTQLLSDVADSEEKYQELVEQIRRQQAQIEAEVAQLERTSAQRIDAIRQSVLARLEDSDSSNDELTEEEQAIIDNAPVSLQWPLVTRGQSSITCGFHCTGYPFAKLFPHTGIDVATPMRSPVYASASGYVVRVKFDPNSSALAYVYIDHGQNIMTGYLHLNEILLSPDQYVSKGQLIGYSGGLPGTVGAGPYSTGAHLHFEVRAVVNGILQAVDPLGYIQ